MAVKSGGKGMLIFGLGWMLASLPFGLVGRHMLKTEGRFEKESVTVPGVVVNKRVEETSTYDQDTKRRKRTETFWVHFKFQTADGRALESKDSVGREAFEELKSGAPVEVQYLKDAPQTNRLARQATFVAGYAFLAFNALAVAIGAVSLFFFFGGKKETNRLMQYGVSTEGTVTKVGPGSVTVNHVPQWQISYIYKDVRGREWKGTTKHMPPDRAMVWVAGDKGPVKYDPGKPQKSLWVGRG